MNEKLVDFFQNWTFPEEKFEHPKSTKCHKCKFGYLRLIWNHLGQYFECDHCGWTSNGSHGTKDKYRK